MFTFKNCPYVTYWSNSWSGLHFKNSFHHLLFLFFWLYVKKTWSNKSIIPSPLVSPTWHWCHKWLQKRLVTVPVGCFLSAAPSPNSAPTESHRRASPERTGGGDTRIVPGRRHWTGRGSCRERQAWVCSTGDRAARAEAGWARILAGRRAFRSVASTAPVWWDGWRCQSTSGTREWNQNNQVLDKKHTRFHQ